MWIRRVISKIKFWHSQAFHPDQTGFHERLGVLTSLDPRLFADPRNANAYLTRLRVLYTNLDQYNQQLRYLNHFLTTKAVLPNDWCKYSWQEVSMHDFLVNDKGLPLNPVEAFTVFQKNAVTFLHRYELIREAQIDAAGHNARVLSKYRDHILDLARTLLLYTHHDKTH